MNRGDLARWPTAAVRMGQPGRAFVALALSFGLFTAIFLVWMAVRFGGPRLTDQVDDLGELVAAGVGGTCCLVAARRVSGQARAAWCWIGAGALCWAAGEASWSWYDIVRGVTVPFPSLADAGFLAEVPLLVVGVLVLPAAPANGLSRARALLDGVLLGGSLLFVSWATVLGSTYRAGAHSAFAQAVSLAYPLADVLTVTVALSVLSRADRRYRGTLGLIIAGMLALALSDSAFVYLTQTTSYSAGAVVDTGWVAGFFLLGLAALWPALPVGHEPRERPASLGLSIWQIVLPSALLAGSALFVGVRYAFDRRLDAFLVVNGLVLVATVVVRQVVALVDNGRLTRTLAHQARHDPLTGIANRAYFSERLASALGGRRRSDERLVVLLCDLDGFKDVNDSLGHFAGDAVLCEVARRLRSSVRPSDAVARLGGDEFAVVLSGIATEEQASAVAIRIVDAMRVPVTAGSKDWIPFMSIGIATSRTGGATTAELLLREADVALYAAKGAGGDTFRHFDPQMGVAYFDQVGLVADLSFALRRDQLSLTYEPVVRLGDSALVGVRALVRWEHPSRGLIEAQEFATMAEQSEASVEIGHWVLSQALSLLRRWRDTFPDTRELWFGVPLWLRQLKSADVVTRVTQALESAGLDPASLRLELSGWTVDQLDNPAVDALHSLELLGVGLVCDGHPGGALFALPSGPHAFHAMQIDWSLVRGLGPGAEGVQVVDAMVRMAHTCKMEVVCGGLASEQDRETLRGLGCDLGYGPQWRRANEAAECEQWFRSRVHEPVGEDMPSVR